MQHTRFIARTVIVENNNIESACRVINRVLGKEGIFDQYRRTRFYEKPFQVSSSRDHSKYAETYVLQDQFFGT